MTVDHNGSSKVAMQSISLTWVELSAIKLTAQLDDIRRRCPKYWHSADAQRMIETLKDRLSQARQLTLF